MKEIEKLFEDIEVARYPLTDDNYDAVENFMAKLLSSKLEGVDDLLVEPYLSYNVRTSGLSIHGKVRFCVYRNILNKKNPRRTEEQTLNFIGRQLATIHKENGSILIHQVHQPNYTPGISFNGIYPEDNTIYLEAYFTVAEGGKIL